MHKPKRAEGEQVEVTPRISESETGTNQEAPPAVGLNFKKREHSMNTVMDMFEMLDLFYANKHLYEKIKAYRKRRYIHGCSFNMD